jgi:6-phosphofructokinase
VYRRHGHVVAVVTETMRDELGRPFADPSLSGEKDAFGHPLLRGTADAMCRLVQSELGLRCRYDKPGGLQRMSMLCASSLDLAEAAELGREAVRMVAEGETDRMVTIIREGDNPYRWRTGSSPLDRVANRQMLLPDGFLTPDGRGTTDAFRQYAGPLIGPEALPAYARLQAPRATVL